MENNQNPTILVLGSSGTIGKQVVKELEGKPVNVRITSRKQDVVEQLCSEGKDCRYLDLDDPKTFALALAGVDRVFLLTGYTVGMLTQSKTLVDAAKKQVSVISYMCAYLLNGIQRMLTLRGTR